MNILDQAVVDTAFDEKFEDAAVRLQKMFEQSGMAVALHIPQSVKKLEFIRAGEEFRLEVEGKALSFATIATRALVTKHVEQMEKNYQSLLNSLLLVLRDLNYWEQKANGAKGRI